MYFDISIKRGYSFLAKGDFCHLLITFAKGFALDQDGQNVSPDLGPNCLIVFLNFFFIKLILKKSQYLRHNQMSAKVLTCLLNNLTVLYKTNIVHCS